MLADCCHSGALYDECRRRNREDGDKELAYAALTSSYSHNTSTGNWTYSDSLLAGFRGEGQVDLNYDGVIELNELAHYTDLELAFLEGQKSMFFAPRRFPGRQARLGRGRSGAARRPADRSRIERPLVQSENHRRRRRPGRSPLRRLRRLVERMGRPRTRPPLSAGPVRRRRQGRSPMGQGPRVVPRDGPPPGTACTSSTTTTTTPQTTNGSAPGDSAAERVIRSRRLKAAISFSIRSLAGSCRAERRALVPFCRCTLAATIPRESAGWGCRACRRAFSVRRLWVRESLL